MCSHAALPMLKRACVYAEDWMDVGTNGEARAVSGKQQGAPFVEAMMAPELTRTENMAATYGSSGSALVDFFFSVLPDTAPQDVQKALRRVRGCPPDWLNPSTLSPLHNPPRACTQHWVAPADLRQNGSHKQLERLLRDSPHAKTLSDFMAEARCPHPQGLASAAYYHAQHQNIYWHMPTALISRPPHRLLICQQAWVEEPLSALQLAAHLRDVRDGKGERERFHDAAAWLAARHPATLLANLEGIAQVCQCSVRQCLAVAINRNPACRQTCPVIQLLSSRAIAFARCSDS